VLAAIELVLIDLDYLLGSKFTNVDLARNFTVVEVV
jgi:hypothetical protein